MKMRYIQIMQLYNIGYKKSKIVKVTMIKIHRQIFTTKERYKLAENLSFILYNK